MIATLLDWMWWEPLATGVAVGIVGAVYSYLTD